MKKVFLIVFMLLTLIQSSFALTILGSDDTQRQYFSLSDSTVKIQTNNNLSNYSIVYTLSNITKVTNYSLTSCNGIYCGQFSLVNLLSGSTNSNSFNIIAGSETKTIYLDTQNPSFNLTNYTISKTDKKLTLEYNYSDNYLVKSVSLYKKTTSSNTFITSLNSSTQYIYSLSESGTLTLLFKIEDNAGNMYEKEQTFTIPDLFAPQIISTKLIIIDESFELNFKVKDPNLKRYEISQGDLVLNGVTQGTEFSNTVKLPFTSGDIIFKVYDSDSNSIQKTITLTSNFENKYPSKYSNTDTFKFTSNANTCVLTKIDSESESETFEKDDNQFELELDISKNKDHTLKFYCEDANIREYFEREFFYDTHDPSKSDLTAEKTDSGTIKLTWTQAHDNESSIEYILYRDDDKIYDGTKEKYEDDDVEYPTEYTYYLKIVDEAGNDVKTDEISIVPIKAKVSILTNLLKEETITSATKSITLATEPYTDITITIKNSGKVISQNTYSITDSQVHKYDLKFESGLNEVIIKGTDSFNNFKEQSYFVTYDAPIVVKPTTSTEQTKSPSVNPVPVIVPQKVEETNTTVVEKLEDASKTSTFWLWILFWTVIICILAWFLLYKRGKLYNKFYTSTKKSTKKIDHYTIHRKKDYILRKTIAKVRKERELRQRQKQEEEQKKTLLRARENASSDFQKKKFSDLANRKTLFIPFDIRQKSKKRIKNIKKETSFEEQLTSSKSNKHKESFFSSLFSIFRQKSKKKEDSFTNYLNRKQNSPGWNNRDYVLKPEIKDDTFNKKEEKREESSKSVSKEEVPIAKNEVKQESSNLKQKNKSSKISLDDYLNKRTRKKRFFFIEKEVERDISNRER